MGTEQRAAPRANTGKFEGEHAEYGMLEKAHLTRPSWLVHPGGPLITRDRQGRFFLGWDDVEDDDGLTLEGAEAVLSALACAVADAGGNAFGDAEGPADQSLVGIYDKFEVRRRDGRDLPGGDREGACYFVLDRTHDEFSGPALRAYAEAARDEYPALARELLAAHVEPLPTAADTARAVDRLAGAVEALLTATGQGIAEEPSE